MSPSFGMSLSVFTTTTTVFYVPRSGTAPSRPSLSLVTMKFAHPRLPASPVCGLLTRSLPAFVDLFFVKKVSVLVTSKRACPASGMSMSAPQPLKRLMINDALLARTRSPRTCRSSRNRHLSQRGCLPPLRPQLPMRLTWARAAAHATTTSAVPLVLSR